MGNKLKGRHLTGNADRRSFFSISSDLVTLGMPMLYDLFINSSASVQRDKFVRIFPSGEVLDKNDLDKFKNKYFQLYVLEDQRKDYLKSLSLLAGATDVQKGEVIKDTAIHYLNKLFDSDTHFTTEVIDEAIQGCRESVESMVDMLQGYSVEDLQQLIAKLSFHDFYTYDHSINVSMYCIALFSALKPDAQRAEVVQAGLGGMLHDLGKIRIPTTIINNPGKLTQEQFDAIKQHPDYGKGLIEEHKCHCEGMDMIPVIRAVHEHHENFNGTGYPRGIEGAEIHMYARITAIADFFDALTTKRSYHEVLSIEEALGVMEKTAGKKIDPSLFKIFKKNVDAVALKTKLSLDEHFDPCQPHQELPFIEEGRPDQLDTTKDKNFGKVKFDGSLFGSSKKKQ